MDEGAPGEAEDRRGPPGSTEIASLPWAFRQVAPLTTSDFIREAQRRGFARETVVLSLFFYRTRQIPTQAPIASPSLKRPSRSAEPTWPQVVRAAPTAGWGGLGSKEAS
jgi:hypothetical protein